MSCGCGNDWSNSGSSLCSNPCGVTAANSVTCESLPSQVENFTKQFFGTVVKTEVNGQVSWVLPCDLNVGLPANPRGADEGLACYFLRLFMDGIVGLTGPQGEPGTPGTNGRNSYTVSLASFTQPSEEAPTVQVQTLYNPALFVQAVIMIQGSGWYRVDLADESGNLWLTLIEPFGSVSAGDTITSGKLVVPTGPQGVSITGPIGPQGPQGVPGPTGGTYSTTNSQTVGLGIDYEVTNTFQQVNFGTVNPAVTLPVAGTYLLTATITVYKSGTAPSAPPDAVYLELYDANAAIALVESQMVEAHLTADQWGTYTISVLYTVGGANHSIQLFARTAGVVGDTFIAASADNHNTVINYVRLA